MSYKLLAIYFATSHFRKKKTHSLQSANEEKPTYKRVNVMGGYALHAGCGENEKSMFWEEMDEELRDISDTEKLWVGGDFDDHCGRNDSGKEETIGKYGVGESNEAGEKCVAFAISHNMRVVNTYFEKAERHKITYNS